MTNLPKIFYFFLLLLVSLKVYSAPSIVIWQNAADDDPTVQGRYQTTYDYQSFVTGTNGDGKATTSAYDAYVPLYKDADSLNNLLSTPGAIPRQSEGYLKFSLTITNDSSEDLYLTAVVDTTGSGDWNILELATPAQLIPQGTSGATYSPVINLEKYCLAIGCSSLNGSSSRNTVHFFLSTTQHYYGDNPLSDSDFGDTGIYFNLYISDNVYTSTGGKTPTISELQKGDGRLTLLLDGAVLGNAYKTVVFQYSSALENGNEDYTTAKGKGSILESLDPIGSSRSELTVNGLSNGTQYNLAVASVDRYQMMSYLSSSQNETPEQIDSFLQKNACYFLSAGFGEEHYVLNYFRSFRDKILTKTKLGRDFVFWYYSSAPKFALAIYKSPALRALSRAAGYVLYFVFNFWPMLAALFGFLVLVVIKQRQRIGNT